MNYFSSAQWENEDFAYVNKSRVKSFIFFVILGTATTRIRSDNGNPSCSGRNLTVTTNQLQHLVMGSHKRAYSREPRGSKAASNIEWYKNYYPLLWYFMTHNTGLHERERYFGDERVPVFVRANDPVRRGPGGGRGLCDLGVFFALALRRRTGHALPRGRHVPLPPSQVRAKCHNKILLTSLVLLLFTNIRPRGFNTPCVPLIPVLGILINIYLMLRLSSLTLIRFSIWMVIGKPLLVLFIRNCCTICTL